MGPNDRNIEYVAAFPYLERTLHKSLLTRTQEAQRSPNNERLQEQHGEGMDMS